MTIVTPNPYADKDTDDTLDGPPPLLDPAPDHLIDPEDDTSEDYAEDYADDSDTDHDTDPEDDSDTDTFVPEGDPTSWVELKSTNRALYNKARVAGLIRNGCDVSGLLEQDTTTGLMEHLNRVPRHALPEPLALELDIATVVADLVRGLVRWYRNKEAEQGGRWEAWDGTRWDIVGPDEMETLVGSLIHPKPNSEVPQLIRPVNSVKLSKDRAFDLQADGVLALDSEGHRFKVTGTDIAVSNVYVPAIELTGKVATVRNVVASMKGSLLHKTPLDLDVEDPSRWNINLANGYVLELSEDKVVDPATGDFLISARPVERTDFVHKRTLAGWNPDLLTGTDTDDTDEDADSSDDGFDPQTLCPKWRKFVKEVCMFYDETTASWVERPEHERVLQTLAGATLLPTPAAHRMGFIYGDLGNNGKSLFVDTLLEVFADYGYQMDPQAISRTNNDPHPTDLMGTVGARMVALHEFPRNGYDPTKAKRQVTDKKVKARKMGQDMGSYTRTANLWMTANETPAVVGDSGFWKRLVLFPFNARWFSKDDPDDLKDVSLGPENSNLMNELLAEKDEILLWMLEGLHMFYVDGLEVPESMQQSKSDAQGSASEWVLFLDEYVDFTGDPADILDDKLIWEVWKSYVDTTLQGKFDKPNKPNQVQHEFLHVFPKARRRGRGRIGSGARERNGFGGVRFTPAGVKQFGFAISSYTSKNGPSPQPMNFAQGGPF